MANIPCNKAIISASHNVDRRSQEEVDGRIRTAAERYLVKNPDFKNYKFQRVEDAPVDELKFLMPVTGHIPSLVFHLIYAAKLGLTASVVGSSDVGKVVQAVKDSGMIDGMDRIVFAHEGEKLSLANSFRRGREALDMHADEAVMFVCPDIPFAFGYAEMLADPDWSENDAVLNFNSRQAIFPDKELFSRNYYHVLKEGNKRSEFKEANVWQFSGRAMDNLISIANIFYSSRNSGGVGFEETLEAAEKKKSRLGLVKTVVSAEPIGIFGIPMTWLLRKMGIDRKYRVRADTLEKIASDVLDCKVKVKADHDNPWQLRDIDAWHDLLYYQHILQAAKKRYNAVNFGGLPMINPYAEEIWSLEPVMRELGQEITLIGDFPEYANTRARKLGFEQPYDANRRLTLEATEDLEAAIDDLVMRTERFKHSLHSGGSLRSSRYHEAGPLHGYQSR